MGVLIPNQECVEDFHSPATYCFRLHVDFPLASEEELREASAALKMIWETSDKRIQAEGRWRLYQLLQSVNERDPHPHDTTWVTSLLDFMYPPPRIQPAGEDVQSS